MGGQKKPWKCNHEKLYAHGLCQNCYINAYNKKRNEKLKTDKLTPERNFEHKESEMEIIQKKTTIGEAPLTIQDKAAFSALEEQDNTKGTR